MEITTMRDDFIEMTNDIDLLYGFIYESAENIVNNLYDHNNYNHLAIKLYSSFVINILVINITKSEHIKEYNEHVKNSKYINRNCSYLMDICLERYFELSKDEYSKIKKFIDNNIDTFESILAPIHDFNDLYKRSYNNNNYRYYPYNYHCIKNYNEYVFITSKYSEFCEKNNYILKEIIISYFNV